MSNKPANTAQRKWMDDITVYINEIGLGYLYGIHFLGRYDFQRHHVLGRSAKQNKVHVGHWFIIPVPFELHDPNMNHQFHVGKCKKAFVKQFGTQRALFDMMYQGMKEHGYKVPDIDIYDAIMSTSA